MPGRGPAFSGAREQSFTLSRPRPEGCRLQVTTPARTLQLASADCARIWPLLTEPWLSRTLLLLDDARLSSVQARCGDKTQTLARRSDGFFVGERRLSADERRDRLRQLRPGRVHEPALSPGCRSCEQR